MALIKVFFLFFILSSPIVASPIHFDLKHFNLSLGGEYLSNISKRGLNLYEGQQIIPIFALEAFSKNFVLVGSTIHFRYKYSDNILLRSHLNLNSANSEPLFETSSQKPIERKHSVEWDHIVEFNWRNLITQSLLFSKDITSHHGFYFESKSRLTLAKLPLDKINIESSLTFTAGYGSSAHNKYLYGYEGKGASATHYDIGFNLTAPPKLDHIFPFFEIHYYKLSQQTKKGLFVKNDSGLQFLMLFALKVK